MAPVGIQSTHIHETVEAIWAQECRVNSVGCVCGSQNHDTVAIVCPVSTAYIIDVAIAVAIVVAVATTVTATATTIVSTASSLP